MRFILPSQHQPGFGIDLQQLDLAFRVGTEIEARVVAASQPLEQARGTVDHLLLLLIGQRRLAILDLGPIGAVGLPFEFVAQNLRQLLVELGVVDLQDRQRAQALVGIADHLHRIFRAGQELLHQHAALREIRAQAVEGVEQAPSRW